MTKADSEQLPDSFNFDVDSALLSELGEKLVTTVTVALSELVKNAYDADAVRLDLTIDLSGSAGPSVTLVDNGSGMTRDQVDQYWMSIGTTNKVSSPESPRFGRLRTGAKGVGRFACRRLGTHLKLVTCAELEAKDGKASLFEHTEVNFNWLKFTPGTRVGSIDNMGRTWQSKRGPTGTRLEIGGAPTNEWNKRSLDYLWRQLCVLAANAGTRRAGFEEDPGFKILFTSPGHNQDEPQDVREQLIEATWGTLEGSVGRDGEAKFSLMARGLGPAKTYVARERFDLIPGTKLRIGILPIFEKSEYRAPHLLTKTKAREIVDEWGGVQVRLNSFRMYPYGDQRDDWLGIDADRARRLGKPSDELVTFAKSLRVVDPSRTLLNMLSSRNYLGDVSATSTTGALQPKMDRQGFVDNAAFHQLRSFTRLAIDWANIQRDAQVQQREKSSLTSARKELSELIGEPISNDELLTKAASYVRRVLDAIKRDVPAKHLKPLEFALRTIKAISEAGQARQHQLEHLRLLASSSTLTLLFSHEIRTLAGLLSVDQLRLRQIAASTKGKPARELEQMANAIQESQERFSRLVQMTSSVGAFDRNPTAGLVALGPAVDASIACFDQIARDYSITYTSNITPPHLSVGPVVQGEVFTILLNLLTNATKAVIAKGKPRGAIAIHAERLEDVVSITVLDTGIGLDAEFRDEVFKPFISDPSATLYRGLETHVNKQDTFIMGTGTGLGLSIVRDIAEARQGGARFVDAPKGWATAITIQLPSQERMQ